jgi:hypothetical protein
MVSITEIERLEYQLLDLSSRLPAGSPKQQQCEEGLGKLRGMKRAVLAANPDILRKAGTMRTHQSSPLVDASEVGKLVQEAHDRADHDKRMAKLAKLEKKRARKMAKAAHPAAWGLNDSVRTLALNQTVLAQEKVLASLRPSQLLPSQHPALRGY